MLGLDLRGRRIRAVAMRQNGCLPFLSDGPHSVRKPAWQQTGSIDLLLDGDAATWPEDLRRNVRPLLTTLPRGQRQLVLCAPTADLVVHQSAVPVNFDDNDIQALVNAEADNWLPGEVGDFLLDFICTAHPDRADERLLRLFACPRQALTAWLELCDAAGLKPDVVDIEVMAAQRLFVAQPPPAATAQSLILDIETQGIAVHLSESGIPVFSRYYPLGSAPAATELRGILHRVSMTLGIKHPVSVMVLGDCADSDAVASLLRQMGLAAMIADQPDLALARSAAMRRHVTGVLAPASGAQ